MPLHLLISLRGSAPLLNEEFGMREIYPVLQEVIDSGGEFRLSPRGTSMLPLLREGRDSVVLVAKKHLKKRQICLYRRADGSFVLHRILSFDKAGQPVFCGDNQMKREYGIKNEDVIAVVVAVYRGEKRKNTTDLSLRFYSFFHCLMPCRRLSFFLRRVRNKLFLHKKKKD